MTTPPESPAEELTVHVNGSERSVPPGATLADVVREAVGERHAGVAAALGTRVVPAEAWATTALQPGDRIEVLTPVAGG